MECLTCDGKTEKMLYMRFPEITYYFCGDCVAAERTELPKHEKCIINRMVEIHGETLLEKDKRFQRIVSGMSSLCNAGRPDLAKGLAKIDNLLTKDKPKSGYKIGVVEQKNEN